MSSIRFIVTDFWQDFKSRPYTFLVRAVVIYFGFRALDAMLG